jgi:hypothetical protein
LSPVSALVIRSSLTRDETHIHTKATASQFRKEAALLVLGS